MKSRRAQFLLFTVLLLAGCATYQSKVKDARKLFDEHKPAEAAKLLEPLATEDGKDQLIYMLDYATALQQAGDYKKSAQEFGDANKLVEIKDYHSISKITESLILSEEMKQYKGDDYEKVLINAVNAINYLEMGQLDDALVEVRQLNEKLHLYKTEAKKNYEQNPYAFYLSACIWEASGRWDDAYIDYKNAYDLVPNYRPLHEDLIRSAIRAQRSDDVAAWRSKFPEVKINPEWKDPTMGQIILVYQQGWGPRKGPRRGAPRFPQLYPVPTRTHQALFKVEDGPVVASSEIYSVQDVAIKTLNDDYAALVAGRVAGVVTKAVISDQIAQHNQVLGLVSMVALNAADRADVRQWSTLPQTFQFARTFVKAGKYRYSIDGRDSQGRFTGENTGMRDVKVSPGRTTFVTWRSFN
jgi:hypothetical protein